MGNTIRDQRQAEFADVWLKEKFGILNLCPRFGKIFTTINILKKLDKHATILIAYPDVKIKESWEHDFVARKYKNPNITYTTHLSLHKYKDKLFDLVIIDEIHLLSDAQLDAAEELLLENMHVLGLTGTLARDTELELLERLELPVIAEYPIEQAINEGVIVDYQITVKYVPLDNKIKINYKDKLKTEKQQFDAYGWVINKVQAQGKDTMFL